MLDAEFLLPESKRKRLEKTWPGAFRDVILPILLEIEPEFAHKYHETHGAPNKSVAVMLGLTILQAYKNLARLFEEQCEVEAPEKDDESEDDKIPPRVALKKPKDVASDSLQNPSDPDATFSGHKGQGYQAQIAETCHEENDFELITYVETEGAHESDQNAPGRIHENLIERGHAPQAAFVDPGYMSGNNIIEAETQGVDLHGPIVIGNKPSEDKAPLSDFQFNAKRTRVEKCPAAPRARDGGIQGRLQDPLWDRGDQWTPEERPGHAPPPDARFPKRLAPRHV